MSRENRSKTIGRPFRVAAWRSAPYGFETARKHTRAREDQRGQMRILLVGHGKMGRLVGELAGQYDCTVAGVIDPASPMHGGGPDADRWTGVDVAIDFSIPDVVPTNLPALARRGISMVVGTTGWARHEAAMRDVIADAGVGIVVAPNFS